MSGEIKTLDLSKRQSLRGIKKCPSCGQISGQRAQLCSNTACELRIKKLAAIRPFDPIRLVAKPDIQLYSLRCKEREKQPRNFVAFFGSIGQEQNSNAHCYVDQCGLCGTQPNRSPCKHINACKAIGITAAEFYPVNRDVLWRQLIVSDDQKAALWNIYEAQEDTVQRLNDCTFAVRCQKSNVFPSGFLHVTAISNGMSSKKGAYACACKKLKIIVEPDNSLVMQEEICDHILLVLAAVLSNQKVKSVYGNFLSALQPFWIEEKQAQRACYVQKDAFLGMNLSGSENIDQEMPDELLICMFGNDYMGNEALSDFSTQHGAAVVERKTAITSIHTTELASAEMLYTGDPNLVSSCDISEQDADMQFEQVVGSLDDTHLELTDCNIELMDQFQLTDQIDLNSDDITIPLSGESINILGPSVFSESFAINETATAVPVPVPTSTTTSTQISNNTTHALLPLPPIELPTIAVVKKKPIKAGDVVTEIKTRKHPHLPAKRALIVNTTTSSNCGVVSNCAMANALDAPALAYTAWLDYVVEALNACVEPAEQRLKSMQCSFHVHKETFAQFSKSFSTGIKRRTPNAVSVIKDGRHKGLSRYSWYFNSVPTVRRIFSTQNISIQMERAFERNTDGSSYVPYIRKPNEDCKQRRIYPKISLYLVRILFGNAADQGLHLTWTPDVFPISQFGLLNIDFILQTLDPNVNLNKNN